MSEFSKNSNFDNSAGVSQVKYGFERPILEVELNEMQQVLKDKIERLATRSLGNGLCNVGSLSYSAGVLEIENEIAIVEGKLINITKLKLPVVDGDSIFLRVVEKEVDFTATLKKEGNEQEVAVVDNYLMDERYGIETSRRIIEEYNLVKVRAEDGAKYLKLGRVSGGAFQKEHGISNSIAYEILE